MKERLNEVLQKTKGIHEQMTELLCRTLTDSEDSVWIDEITFNVDISSSEMKEYLECMKDNPLSINMSTRHGFTTVRKNMI